MQAADAFCLPSTYEGMPITLIECFSVGAIPLCTPVGGMINMIRDGQNGLLAAGTRQSDIEVMLERFLQLSPAEADAMRQHSKASFAIYDMQQCAQRYVRLFAAAENDRL